MAEYSPEDFKPGMHCMKQQEMSVRRAYQLNAGLMECLSDAGDLLTLKQGRKWYIVSNKSLRDALSFSEDHTDYAIRDQDTWEWVIDHWYSGGLKRSVRVTGHNITQANRDNIDHNIRELHG